MSDDRAPVQGSSRDVSQDWEKYSMESFLIHGLPMETYWDYDHHVIPPITASTTFRLDSVERGHQGFCDFGTPVGTEPARPPIYIYDRVAEPTIVQLEHAMTRAEGGVCATAFASGMAAISAAISVSAKHGDHILVHKTVYGCTYSLFSNWAPRLGLDVRFLDMRNLEELAASIKPETRVIYFETPANPTMDLIDIAAVAGLCRQVNEHRAPHQRLRIIVDNTFATSFCQRPLSQGADIVVHSLTKNIMGFGTDMGGILISADVSLDPMIRLYRKDFGGVLSPRAAWNILVYGLPTLAVRSRRQIQNCFSVAGFLEKHPRVRRVVYPGLESHRDHELAKRQMVDFKGKFAPGSMIYFELDADGDQTRRFMNTLAKDAYTITLAVSLGQLKTLVEAPGLMTHSSYPEEEAKGAGMSEQGIRLSLGIEDPEDIISDLTLGFEKI